MTFEMTSKLARLFTEAEIGQERVFEIRIRDLRNNKQRSFSLLTKRGAKVDVTVDELKEFFEKVYKEGKKK